MRHPSGQVSEGFDLLRLAQLLFERPAGGDVLHDKFKSLHNILLIGQWSTAQADPDDFPVSSSPVHFVFDPVCRQPLLNQARSLLWIHIDFCCIQLEDFVGRVIAQHGCQRRIYF